ncbi:peptidase M15 [Streptomyces sp. KL109B]|uniref:peptidase M15 n=1 Tax=Streptomyces sp. KL109B TaxID=3045155 RepID=UPI00278BC409|nr:peptidase M15 [Streptomyces sp. KL109B]
MTGTVVASGTADGDVTDGTTVFDEDVPAVGKLDPGLGDALRKAAGDAAGDGVEFRVNSGWRSPETSEHVSGDAVDLGGSGAAEWLSEHGARYGLCQIYANEPWHFELRPAAVDRGCPAEYADPTEDPRLQK